METNLRITTIVILFISAYLILPKIGHGTATFNDLMVNNLSRTSSQSLSIPKDNSQGSKAQYIPPNYGGPDSRHGSGTR